jgi:hypothetical protein
MLIIVEVSSSVMTSIFSSLKSKHRLTFLFIIRTVVYVYLLNKKSCAKKGEEIEEEEEEEEK